MVSNGKLKQYVFCGFFGTFNLIALGIIDIDITFFPFPLFVFVLFSSLLMGIIGFISGIILLYHKCKS